MVLNNTLQKWRHFHHPTDSNKHLRSSPHCPQNNGQAEDTIKTVKGLLQDSPEIFLSLFRYCTAPLPWCGLSPGELLSSGQMTQDKCTRNQDMSHPKLASPHRVCREGQGDEWVTEERYGQQHSVCPILTLPNNTPVWVNTQGRQVPGRGVTSTLWSSQKKSNSSDSSCRDCPTSFLPICISATLFPLLSSSLSCACG